MNANLNEASTVSSLSSFECSECGGDVSADDNICPACGNDVSETIDVIEPEPKTKEDGNPIFQRYLYLYRSSRHLIAFGNTVKVIGVVAGIGMLLLSLFAGAATSNVAAMGALGVMGAVYGLLFGGFIFLLGTLISAQGQIILVQADSAVHTSPFMNKNEKANLMSASLKPVDDEGIQE